MNRLKLAGWVARTRPLTEPLSPRGPQPVLTMLENRYGALNGSGEPFEKYPSCSTAGAGAGFVEESEDCSKLFIIKLLEDTGPAVPAGPRDGKLGKSTSGCAHTLIPLRNPPRWPVRATRPTVRASTSRRKPGSMSPLARRAWRCIHQETQISTLEVRAKTK